MFSVGKQAHLAAIIVLGCAVAPASAQSAMMGNNMGMGMSTTNCTMCHGTTPVVRTPAHQQHALRMSLLRLERQNSLGQLSPSFRGLGNGSLTRSELAMLDRRVDAELMRRGGTLPQLVTLDRRLDAALMRRHLPQHHMSAQPMHVIRRGRR
jgi:hypothetical protein